MSQNREGIACDIILMISVAANATTAKTAITAAAQKTKPAVATQYFMMFSFSLNDPLQSSSDRWRYLPCLQQNVKRDGHQCPRALDVGMKLKHVAAENHK
jgi:hypothetical protein